MSSAPVRHGTAVILGRACYGLLLDKTEAALAAIDRKAPDEALELVVEATVPMSGLAFESGGLSIAHSMTRGLTALKPWSKTLHGFQVAYANLVQIRLEGRPDAEIAALADFYGRVGLPRSLAELAAAPDAEALDAIAGQSMSAPHIRHSLARSPLPTCAKPWSGWKRLSRLRTRRVESEWSASKPPFTTG